METTLLLELRERLAQYVSGQVPLSSFNEWFTSATWGIDETNDFLAQQLSYEIEHRLAEFSNGDWDEDELMAHLRCLIPETTWGSRNQMLAAFNGRLVAA